MALVLISAVMLPGSAFSEPDLYSWVRSISEGLKAPTALAVDGLGNVYVAESVNNRLLRYDRDGHRSGKIMGLERPVSVAISPEGNILVGNAGKGTVEVYDRNFKPLFKLGAGDGEFLLPGGIAVDEAGRIYVADSKRDIIKVYNSEGSFNTSIGGFHFPTSITINRRSGEILVCDSPVVQFLEGPTGTARVQVFDADGHLKRSFGDFGQGEGKLMRAMGTAVDSSGRIYVSDSYQNVVRVFDPEGHALGAIYATGNPLRTPMGMAISRTDHLYVSSLNTGKVEVFKISGKSRKKR